MVKVNSILTDYAMTKLAALVARTEQAAPHLVELALDALEAELDKQSEYAPQPAPDARPWTDAATPPDNNRDVEIVVNGLTCTNGWYADDAGGWRIFEHGNRKSYSYSAHTEDGQTVTAWREIAQGE